MGRTLPIFNSSGNSPEEKGRLKICDGGEASMLIDSFIGKIQRPSAPSLLLFLEKQQHKRPPVLRLGKVEKYWHYCEGDLVTADTVPFIRRDHSAIQKYREIHHSSFVQDTSSVK